MIVKFTESEYLAKHSRAVESRNVALWPTFFSVCILRNIHWGIVDYTATSIVTAGRQMRKCTSIRSRYGSLEQNISRGALREMVKQIRCNVARQYIVSSCFIWQDICWNGLYIWKHHFNNGITPFFFASERETSKFAMWKKLEERKSLKDDHIHSAAFLWSIVHVLNIF